VRTIVLVAAGQLAAGSLLADIQNGGWQVVPDASPAAPPVASDISPVPSGPAPDGAVAAMLAIDPRYVDGIVVVTARNGNPDPSQWTVVARDGDNLGVLHQITVADGQVIADRQSLNAYESFRQDVAIDPTMVQVDSGAAFSLVLPIAAANNKIIGHVDYALTVRGTDAAPLWTLNCFDVNGSFLGKVVLLATTGTVLSHSGFPLLPATP
jgi:hypothetical protein